MTALRKAGIAVNVWTVNQAEDMQRLVQAGVTGIFTDFPQLLSTHL
jgi:glycerophosphoryl diester phosphodiesterase